MRTQAAMLAGSVMVSSMSAALHLQEHAPAVLAAMGGDDGAVDLHRSTIRRGGGDFDPGGDDAGRG